MISLHIGTLMSHGMKRRRFRGADHKDFDALEFGEMGEYGVVIVPPGAFADLDPEPWRADVSILLPEA